MTLSQDSLVAIAVATVSAASAITAAVIAARSAERTRVAELRAAASAAEASEGTQRVKELEDRIADRKGQLYQDLIDFLRVVVDPGTADEEYQRSFVKKRFKLDTWIALYGSDDVLSAYNALNTSFFVTAKAPHSILLRLYAELVIAVRRDLGYPDTQIAPDQVLNAIHENLYLDPEVWPDVNLPLRELYQKNTWVPPRENKDREPHEVATKLDDSQSVPNVTPAQLASPA